MNLYNRIGDYNQAKHTFYKRFMDDSLCIWRNQNKANEFLNYLNDRHLNIKFTDAKEYLNKVHLKSDVSNIC